MVANARVGEARALEFGPEQQLAADLASLVGRDTVHDWLQWNMVKLEVEVVEPAAHPEIHVERCLRWCAVERELQRLHHQQTVGEPRRRDEIADRDLPRVK